jgi:hypothetical protein
MKISEWEQAKRWLTRPARKVDEGKVILDYIDSVKEKYGDSEPKYKSKLERLAESPQYKYEGFADGQKQSDVTGQKNPNYKPPPKDFFEKLLPLPKNKYPKKLIAKKPKPIEPLNFDWKLGDWTNLLDHDYKPEPTKPEETKKIRQGLAYLLKI